MPKTLKQLREDAGLTLEQAVQRMRDIDPRSPRTHVGLIHIEQRGTQKYRIVKVLAETYGVPIGAIEAAAAENKSDICA